MSLIEAIDSVSGKPTSIFATNGKLETTATGGGAGAAVPTQVNSFAGTEIAGVGMFGNLEGATTFKSLKVDAQGHLLTSGGGGATATDLSARTAIATPATSTFLKCDALGALEINNSYDLEMKNGSPKITAGDAYVSGTQLIGVADQADTGGKQYNPVLVNNSGELVVKDATLSTIIGGGALFCAEQNAEISVNGQPKVSAQNNFITNGIMGADIIGTPNQFTTALVDITGNLLTTNLDITKGKDPTAVDAELQQVLMYGKNPNGTLQPLECVSDRLLVDVLELSPTGALSVATSLPSVQICGFDSGTSQFKTLKCDGNGVLDTSGGGGGSGGGLTETLTQGTLFLADATSILKQSGSAEVNLGTATTNIDYLVLTCEIDLLNAVGYENKYLIQNLRLQQSSVSGARKPLQYIRLVNNNKVPFATLPTTYHDIQLAKSSFMKVLIT